MVKRSENGHKTTAWIPATGQDREIVLEELESILASHHFRGSKRYPALLRYVVNEALNNRAGDLKERILGVEVFGREPGYDTNADPVVRISAGEVRKRIAQYYHESGESSRVQIELPLGCYAPEFLRRTPLADSQDDLEKPLISVENAAGPRRIRRRTILIGLAAILFVGLGIIVYSRYEASAHYETAMLKFWNPLLNSSRPVMIVLGTTHPHNLPPPSEATTFGEQNKNPYHHVSVSTAMALAHIVGVLKQHKKGYEVKEADETNLTDVSSRPIVLVGAINNEWTMRLTKPLRFHFTYTNNQEGAGIESIDDAARPQSTGWSLDSSKPYLSIPDDYAIVARFLNATTGGPVVVIAGIGPFGTEAASELVQSPEYLAQLAAKLPRGWENKNLEVVLKTDIIGVKAGPPILISAYTW
jgi:hypothetical protein